MLFVLGGCGLPIEFRIASWAINGLLFVETGKGASEHVLSAMTQRYCAVVRAMREGSIGSFCKKPPRQRDVLEEVRGP